MLPLWHCPSCVEGTPTTEQEGSHTLPVPATPTTLPAEAGPRGTHPLHGHGRLHLRGDSVHTGCHAEPADTFILFSDGVLSVNTGTLHVFLLKGLKFEGKGHLYRLCLLSTGAWSQPLPGVVCCMEVALLARPSVGILIRNADVQAQACLGVRVSRQGHQTSLWRVRQGGQAQEHSRLPSTLSLQAPRHHSTELPTTTRGRRRIQMADSLSSFLSALGAPVRVRVTKIQPPWLPHL